MRKFIINSSEKVYNFLINFYPKNYRQQFGDEMKFVFSESLRDEYQQKGEPGLIKIWTLTIIDGIKSAIYEYVDYWKGGDHMNTKSKDIFMQNKIFGYLALATVAVLSLPLIAMQFTRDVDWGLFDFLLMGSLLFGAGSIFVFLARKVNKKNRLIVGLVIIGLVLVIWAHLAVGIVDTWPLAGS